MTQDMMAPHGEQDFHNHW